MNQLCFSFYSPQFNRLSVCVAERAEEESSLRFTLRLWNPSIWRYQQQKARIPDCCAFFIEKNLARVALVLSPPRAFGARLYQHRRTQAHDTNFAYE